MIEIDPNRSITLERPLELQFGVGTVAQAGSFAERRGARRPLVIAAPIHRDQVARLNLPGDVTIFAEVDREPDIEIVARVRQIAAQADPDLVVGFGGGSAMDLSKVIAVLLGNDLPLQAIVGKGNAPARRVSLVQVPTTAGTGSEAGPRALIGDPTTGAKLAIESPHMMADAAVIDPQLAVSVPPAITAETGIDALAHCVEAFTNLRAHPIVDLYAREGIRLVGRFLRRAVAKGDDLEARAGMALAALYGGYCLGPVNTAAGHAIAYPLSTQHGIPHGRANAIIFPHVLAYNAPVVEARTREVAQLLGLDPEAAGSISDTAAAFCAEIGITTRLSAHGVEAGHIDRLAAEAAGIRRLLDNNPRPLNEQQIAEIYRAAL